jgi:hypothetical protein
MAMLLFTTMAVLGCASNMKPAVEPAVALPPRESPVLVTLVASSNRGGLFLQPNGPFAVMAFDESALATHIGVIYYGSMGDPVDGDWGITDRFWQDRHGGSDVYSFAWGPDGNTLFVSTGEVYGEACVFRLNLRERKAEIFYPTPDDGAAGTSTLIVGIDSARKVLSIGFPDSDDLTKRKSVVRVPFK